jgi:hypothetical protein
MQQGRHGYGEKSAFLPDMQANLEVRFTRNYALMCFDPRQIASMIRTRRAA